MYQHDPKIPLKVSMVSLCNSDNAVSGYRDMWLTPAGFLKRNNYYTAFP